MTLHPSIHKIVKIGPLEQPSNPDDKHVPKFLLHELQEISNDPFISSHALIPYQMKPENKLMFQDTRIFH